jgi:hypothetical protein
MFSFQSLWAQYPPLGRSWSFSVFTTTGDVNNTGNTVVNNDLGYFMCSRLRAIQLSIF